VGAFDRAVQQLKKRRLWDAVLEGIRAGKPFLGLCLGFQILFERSEEGSGERGLGVIKGSVRRFVFGDEGATKLKIPHMGWNQIRIVKGSCPLLKNVPDESYFYFVHSYYVQCEDRVCVTAETEYGRPFTSMVWRERTFGTQFHPEKSQSVGLTLLKNFVDL